jgi:hypothetical protein
VARRRKEADKLLPAAANLTEAILAEIGGSFAKKKSVRTPD